jgi:hypothetical protein
VSTKSSIAYGEKFHFYSEVMEDDGARYLELAGAEFEASHRGVTVKIPAAIWEVIRQLGAADLSIVDLTDDEIRERAEAQADRNMADYSENSETAGIRSLRRVWGWDRPREEQVAEIASSLKELRADQQRLRTEIQAIRSGMRPVRADQGEARSIDEGAGLRADDDREPKL